jgi:hypothetical protein
MVRREKIVYVKDGDIRYKEYDLRPKWYNPFGNILTLEQNGERVTVYGELVVVKEKLHINSYHGDKHWEPIEFCFNYEGISLLRAGTK